MFKYLLIGMLMIGKTQHAKRTLLLFADRSAQGSLLQQERLLQHDKTGLQQHDIEVKICNPKNAAFYKSNHIRPGFTVILIGKDGGEKLRTHQPVTTQKLFTLIDDVHMRQDEMKHRYAGVPY